MSEVHIGEYIRTEDGYIDKVLLIEDLYLPNSEIIENGWIEGEKKVYGKKDILKHSFNIIDLIEVDDYIKFGRNKNFSRVTHVLYGKGKYEGKPIFFLDIDDDDYTPLDDERDYKKIKCIITHEQMEREGYKV